MKNLFKSTEKNTTEKNVTEIVYILDRSGSMGGLESDTVGGFNSMMEKQKKIGESAFVSTILFDDEFEVLHNRLPIEKIEKMTDEQYFVRGCTALLDAIGRSIEHISDIHSNMDENERPNKTIFVITTDGMENSSKMYSYDKIKEMIKRQQKKYDWEFIFIGANIDSVAEADRIGIKKERAVNYVSDNIGTSTLYAGISKAVCSFMSAPSFGKASECLDRSGWNEEINEDFISRKK
ncbi:MAG: VWA domain-containing protein [Firmicutes bacterium]|nr:VWA domain-containing protein [Bacillota bacterium]